MGMTGGVFAGQGCHHDQGHKETSGTQGHTHTETSGTHTQRQTVRDRQTDTAGTHAQRHQGHPHRETDRLSGTHRHSRGTHTDSQGHTDTHQGHTKVIPAWLLSSCHR